MMIKKYIAWLNFLTIKNNRKQEIKAYTNALKEVYKDIQNLYNEYGITESEIRNKILFLPTKLNRHKLQINFFGIDCIAMGLRGSIKVWEYSNNIYFINTQSYEHRKESEEFIIQFVQEWGNKYKPMLLKQIQCLQKENEFCKLKKKQKKDFFEKYS